MGEELFQRAESETLEGRGRWPDTTEKQSWRNKVHRAGDKPRPRQRRLSVQGSRVRVRTEIVNVTAGGKGLSL